MNTRTKLLSALASAGILAAGWGAATGDGGTITESDSAAGTDTGRTGSTVAPTTSATAPAASTAAGVAGTFTGRTSTHRFGSVAVTVTLTDGRITALSEKVVTDGDHHSERISAQAVPVLKQSLMGTDGSHATTISGATYTTRAYLTSLQSALDKAAR